MLCKLVLTSLLSLGFVVAKPAANAELSNAFRMKHGLAPAWPAALKEIPHNTRIRPIRRTTTTNQASMTTTTQQPTPTPTPIVINVNVDDASYAYTLPVPVTIYGRTETQVFVSSNAVLSLGYGSSAYSNQALPSNSLAPESLCLLWDDLMISGADNGVWYYVTGNDTTFIFKESQLGYSSALNHVTATHSGGVWTLRYYQVAYAGGGATLGVQGTNGRFKQYSYNQQTVAAGLQIIYDTNANTMITGTF